MSKEALFRLVDAEPAREKTEQLFQHVRKWLSSLLPSDVKIRHIGATAVPG
jgi:hypothetical protein